MTEKRFEEYYDESKNEWYVRDTTGKIRCFGCVDLEVVSYICKEWNTLNDENEKLKKELKVYRKIATCGNCNYHNYDWFDDGDEFEVCEKGNDTSNMICEDWEELE